MTDNTYLTEYKNWEGENVYISQIPDERLVHTYSFFLRYCASLRTEGHARDSKYIAYVKNMCDIRDALKHEIKSRKLIMRRFLR